MREKVLKLMELTLTPHEHNVRGIVEQLRSQLLGVVGEHEEACPAKVEGECACERFLPKDAAEAVAAMGESLAAGRAELEDMIVPLYEGALTEEEMDAIIVFNTSPVGRKLARVSPALMEAIQMASSAWSGRIIEGLSERLTALFGMARADLPVEIGGEIPTGILGEMPSAGEKAQGG